VVDHPVRIENNNIIKGFNVIFLIDHTNDFGAILEETANLNPEPPGLILIALNTSHHRSRHKQGPFSSRHQRLSVPIVSLCGPAKVLLQKIDRADNRLIEGAWRCPFLDRQPALNQAQIATPGWTGDSQA